MRHIKRLPEPAILQKKHDEWQRKFDEQRRRNPTARPDAKKYGHPNIKKALDDSSYRKCFYCESMLSGEPKEIDHLVEVAIRPDLAYTWTNLYLSCSNCNDKVNHNAMPVETVLDPCRDSDEEIQANITFEDECVCSQPGATKGLDTIKKYHLGTDVLDLRRGSWLRDIMKIIMDIQKKMIEEGRQRPTQDELQQIKRYMQPDQPYSLMSKVFLEKRCKEWLDEDGKERLP